MAGVKRKRCIDSDVHALHKELDDVSCPICMDHPHNAVLLLCSSHENGCTAYICGTSYRHSNCLDRFKKMRDNSGGNTGSTSSLAVNSFSSSNTSDLNLTLTNRIIEANEYRNCSENDTQDPARQLETLGEVSESWQNRMLQEENNIENISGRPVENNSSRLGTRGESISEAYWRGRMLIGRADLGSASSDLGWNLECPLCRGAILGWKVVEEARRYLNLKKRSCSRESCSFFGNYQELRRHARRVHPTIRPPEIDPSRERAWRSLEHQREYNDIVSAIGSAMPGAMVVGDYVIENGDRMSTESEGEVGEINTPWWTSLFLFHPVDGITEPRSRSRAWTRHHRRLPDPPRFRWGENLLGLQGDVDGDADLQILSDPGEDAHFGPRSRSS